jgi:hypothetical protein
MQRLLRCTDNSEVFFMLSQSDSSTDVLFKEGLQDLLELVAFRWLKCLFEGSFVPHSFRLTLTSIFLGSTGV